LVTWTPTSKLEEREYFNKDYIEGIYRLQMKAKKNYLIPFGLLVTFELFLEVFVMNGEGRFDRCLQ
jgi:hypothetical protein